jgi:iron only hydrogenase large subunit-like protein
MTENKFEPLREFLANEKRIDFILTFEELEDILGFGLPRSAQRAEWWDDDTEHHPKLQRQAIRAGGYDSRRLPEGGKVRFRKMSVFGYGRRTE